MRDDFPLLLDVKKTSEFLGLKEEDTRALMKRSNFPKVWRGEVMYSIRDRISDFLTSIQGERF